MKSIEISGEASTNLNQSFFWMIALIYYSYSFKTKEGVIVICPRCYITHVRLAQVSRYKPLIIIFIVEMLWIKKYASNLLHLYLPAMANKLQSRYSYFLKISYLRER